MNSILVEINKELDKVVKYILNDYYKYLTKKEISFIKDISNKIFINNNIDSITYNKNLDIIELNLNKLKYQYTRLNKFIKESTQLQSIRKIDHFLIRNFNEEECSLILKTKKASFSQYVIGEIIYAFFDYAINIESSREMIYQDDYETYRKRWGYYLSKEIREIITRTFTKRHNLYYNPKSIDESISKAINNIIKKENNLNIIFNKNIDVFLNEKSISIYKKLIINYEISCFEKEFNLNNGQYEENNSLELSQIIEKDPVSNLKKIKEMLQKDNVSFEEIKEVLGE